MCYFFFALMTKNIMIDITGKKKKELHLFLCMILTLIPHGPLRSLVRFYYMLHYVAYSTLLVSCF
jgi:hypothetical protein